MPFSPTENIHDTTVDYNRREAATDRLPLLTPPGWFRHTPPPDKPTIPDTSGLTAPALAEVEAWLLDADTVVTEAGAITYVADYLAFKAALDAWRFANHIGRQAQYRIAYGDGIIVNKATLALSSDETGVGSDPPPVSLAPRNDP